MSQDNKVYWPREKSWWDTLEVPADVAIRSRLFDWLAETSPTPLEHDYILYTDGSGCTHGWGGYAAVIQQIGLDLDEENSPRDVRDGWVHFGGTYGSTVARSELTAFVEGVQQILRRRCMDKVDELDEIERYEAHDAGGILRTLVGPERVSILWYTDRADIAKSLLFDEEGDPLNARRKEVDLWLRYSSMARHVCVTPLHNSRNTIDGQAVCDSLCGIARKSMMAAQELFEAAATNYQTKELWKQTHPQKALF